MKFTTTILAALLFFLTPFTSYAGMNMDMGGMDMNSSKQVMLPMAATDGVSAMAHLLDIKEAMSKMGMDATNHFMIMFTDQTTNELLTKGVVALKITHPDGHTDKPIKLMSMTNAFGSDITLTDKGTHKLTVGTKLSDGKKRTFNFEYTVK
jgi:hypothetical protein